MSCLSFQFQIRRPCWNWSIQLSTLDALACTSKLRINGCYLNEYKNSSIKGIRKNMIFHICLGNNLYFHLKIFLYHSKSKITMIIIWAKRLICPLSFCYILPTKEVIFIKSWDKKRGQYVPRYPRKYRSRLSQVCLNSRGLPDW